jgi:5-methylcytosine-specific restriction endonuclease McrA
MTQTSHRKEYMHLYWLRNKERLLPYHKQYRRTHLAQYHVYEKKSVALHKDRIREYRRKHPEIARRSYDKLKDLVFGHYGGKCACCGESNSAFLCIDHIDGKGNEHRRANRLSCGERTYQWIKGHNYPSGFQILCWNCNAAKHFRGHCPHQDQKKEELSLITGEEGVVHK